MIKRESDHTSYWWMSNHTFQSVPMHWHKYYEIELVVAGQGIQVINGEKEEISRGCLTLLSPRDFHRLEASGQSPLTIRNFCFYEDFLSPEIIALFLTYPAPFVLFLKDDIYNSFFSDFLDLYKDMTGAPPNGEMVIRRKIELIILKMIGILKNCQIPLSPNYQFDQTERDVRILQPVLSYINNHYFEEIKREDLASLLHFSPGYLSDFFKKTFGISLTDYITDIRMKRAKSLIENSDDTIQSIILQVGYNTPSLFYRKFYEYFGVKPTELVRKNKTISNSKHDNSE